MSGPDETVFLQWLKREVRPALGCTEPVAVAFATTTACRYLNEMCISISGFISDNLFKNAMGVTIPGTKSTGIAMSAAVGVFGGDPGNGLEVLKGLTDMQINQAKEMVSQGRVNITAQNTTEFIHIDLTARSEHNSKKEHIEIEELYVNDKPVSPAKKATGQTAETSPDPFSVQDAFNFITTVPLKKIEFILESARLNGALFLEGQRRAYGINVAGMLKATVIQGLMSDDLLSRILIGTLGI